MYFTNTLSLSLALFIAGTIAAPVSIKTSKSPPAAQIASQCQESGKLLQGVQSSISSANSKWAGAASQSSNQALVKLKKSSAEAVSECQKIANSMKSAKETYAKAEENSKAAFS